MAVDKKFFVDINLQGNALKDAVIGSNSKMGTAGSFRFDGTRLEYFDGSSVQSVANLADISAVTGGLILQGGYDAATNTPDIADTNASKGYFWVVTAAGSFLGESVQVGDSIIAKVDEAGASIGDWLILQGNVVIATDSVDGIVRLATQAEVDAGTEGGAVVLTPATFANSQQLADISNDIKDLDNNKISRDGSIAMAGNLDMATNSIINLPAPTADNDAARKGYVDETAKAAQDNAETFATTAANNAQAAAEATASADATAKADAAEANAKSYADSLAPNYDAAGSAATAETNAKAYADSLAPNYDPAGSAATAQANAETFATNAANTAQSNAESYAQTAANNARSAANGYTDAQITAQSSVKFVDTTAWVLSGDFYYAEVLHTLGSYVNFTTTMNAGQVVEFAATMGSDNIVLFSNTVPSSPVLVLLSKVNNNG